jgi:hypothetical protein
METISELVDATLARYGVVPGPCGAEPVLSDGGYRRSRMDTLVREVAIPNVGIQEPLTAQCPEPLPSGF